MIWRWIIRGLGIALLTLCVTAWAGSYWRYFEFMYYGRILTVGTILGDGKAGVLVGSVYRTTRDWQMNVYPADLVHWPNWENIAWNYNFGFAFGGRPDDWYVGVPIWFLALLSALLLSVVWRKTRPKYSGKGFPVEVEGGGGRGSGKEAGKA